MSGAIFISYRRSDSMSTAGRLRDHMARIFGDKRVFMDVDSIPAGADFAQHLAIQLAACDVFLAVIGPNWLAASDSGGRPRLEMPDDYVAMEIAQALGRAIRVIPVLVDGAIMPEPAQLPEPLQSLSRRQALTLRNVQFGRDVEVLVERIRAVLPRRGSKRLWAFVGAASAAGLLAAAWLSIMQISAWIPRRPAVAPSEQNRAAEAATPLVRPEIVDRNGVPLARDAQAVEAFADPGKITDLDAAAAFLSSVFPGWKGKELRARLGDAHGVLWLARDLTPKQEVALRAAPMPGVGVALRNTRSYSEGAGAAHVLGYVDANHAGRAGLERWIDQAGLSDPSAAHGSVIAAIDLRVQRLVREQLAAAQAKFQAAGAAGVVSDVETGEILAMVSLPDYDPNDDSLGAADERRFDRPAAGIYEMLPHAATVAMALDSGRFTLDSTVDVSSPLHFPKFDIEAGEGDDALDLRGIFTLNSNIGAAHLALDLGVERHKDFLRALGQLDPLRVELPERAAPIVPLQWGEQNSAAVAFGEGLGVTPLHVVMAMGALVNGGRLIAPTLIRRDRAAVDAASHRVLKPETSAAIRYLMRLNAEHGTARRADVQGLYVGGATHTLQRVTTVPKPAGGRPRPVALATFIAAVPADRPRYLVLVQLDQPRGLPETYGFATAGWNAAPAAGKLVEQIAPLLGVEPRTQLPSVEQLMPASLHGTR